MHVSVCLHCMSHTALGATKWLQQHILPVTEAALCSSALPLFAIVARGNSIACGVTDIKRIGQLQWGTLCDLELKHVLGDRVALFPV